MKGFATSGGASRLRAVAVLALAAVFCGRVCAEDIGQKNGTRYPLRQSNYSPIIRGLDKVLKRAPLSTLLDEATLQTNQSSDLSSTKWYIDSFNITDDERWEVQGVSSSSDAGDATLLRDEENVLAISYQDTSKKSLGVRVTFIRRGAAYRPSQGRVYQHALLVVPTLIKDDTPSFSALSGADTGGLVWRGNWLYVTDSKEGLRVFDLRHIYIVNDSPNTFVGNNGEDYFGGGHKYVIPQARIYEPSIAKGASLVMHVASLDRNSTVPSILVGEHVTGDEASKANSTFCRYPLDEETNLLKTNSSGVAVPYWSWVTNVRYVEGFVYAKGGFFIARGSSTINRMLPSDRGGILYWVPRSWADEHESMLPQSTQGMTYQPEQDALWVVGGKGGTTFVIALNSDRADVVPDSILKNAKDQEESGPGGAHDSTPPDSEDAKGESSKKLNKAQSAGLAIGVVVAVAIAICIFFLFRRSRNNNQDKEAENTPPLQAHNSGSLHSYNSNAAGYSKPELDGQAVYREPHEDSSDVGSSSPAKSYSSRFHPQPVGAQQIPRRPVPGQSPVVELPSPDSKEYSRFELGGNEKAQRKSKYEGID